MAFIVGIDEVGRGPLAGPVAIGVVKIGYDNTSVSVNKQRRLSKNLLEGIKDSKKLSSEERELWFRLALEAKKEGLLDFTVALVSERVIDKKGISYAIKTGIKRGLRSLSVPPDSQIFLDGGIKAPEEFKHQVTVIRGDEKIPIISLASIIAKVTRDRRMIQLSKKFPEYNFQSHKGYGTRLHLECIKKFGLCEIHRRSFIRGLT